MYMQNNTVNIHTESSPIESKQFTSKKINSRNFEMIQQEWKPYIFY